MALPLIVVGAGLTAAYLGNKLSEHHDRKSGVIGTFPGERKIKVKPAPGAILCCGIYGVFEHSGIWADDTVIELHGSGLVRGVSPERFIQNRSGNSIYLACDSNNTPLSDNATMLRAASQLYDYREYHVINNNCNRFVAECLTGSTNPITRFSELNALLSRHFDTGVHWLLAELD